MWISIFKQNTNHRNKNYKNTRNIKFFLNAFQQFRKHCISDTSIRQNSSDSSSTDLIVIPNRIDNVNENQSAA